MINKIIPPKSSALFLYFTPNLCPIKTPIAESRQVMNPVYPIAKATLTTKHASVIPAASASILVATANRSN